MYTYYIGVGSNLGDRAGYINTAVAALKESERIQAVTVSKLLETEPWGVKEQPAFLNAVIQCDTDLQPKQLLTLLQSLEEQAHRRRVVHWGPRTLDLDILWAEDEAGQMLEVDADTLQIPHPYFWDRLFVLVPLAELKPDFFYRGESIHDRIDRLRH